MIIGFAGQKKSGKSTAAGFLVDQGFVRHSFADPLRDMWVNCEQERLEQLFTEERIVYDDIRFENEADLIRAYGGLVVHIKRPGLAGDDSHPSEAGIAVADADVVLHNDGNLGQLLDAVLALVDRVV